MLNSVVGIVRVGSFCVWLQSLLKFTTNGVSDLFVLFLKVPQNKCNTLIFRAILIRVYAIHSARTQNLPHPQSALHQPGWVQRLSRPRP